MIKRYSFPSEQIAKELILNLDSNDSNFKNVTVTKTTQGLVCLGFQNVYNYNEETKENELIKEGLTYDVDVFWRDAANENWKAYEVNPKTPNHNFL
jgi:hypothetical protein